MARVHGKDLTTFSMDDAGGTPVNLLAELIAINFEVSAAQHDTTTIGDDWFETTSGLKGGDEFTVELFYENTASTGVYAVATGRLGITGTISWGDGTRTTSMETNVSKVSSPVNVGDMMKVTITHKITGAVTFS